MCRFCLAVCFGMALVGSVGCGSTQKGAAPAADVKGTITLDGVPVPTGEVHFVMAGFPPSVLTITNGTYSGQAPIGQNRVEVFLFVEGPPSEKHAGTLTKRNTSPSQYWGPNTILGATVSEKEPNEFKFELTSK